MVTRFQIRCKSEICSSRAIAEVLFELMFNSCRVLTLLLCRSNLLSPTTKWIPKKTTISQEKQLGRAPNPPPPHPPWSPPRRPLVYLPHIWQHNHVRFSLVALWLKKLLFLFFIGSQARSQVDLFGGPFWIYWVKKLSRQTTNDNF